MSALATKGPARRLTVANLRVEPLLGSGCRAEIELETGSGERYTGTAEDPDDLLCTARAALEALRSAAGAGLGAFAVHGVDVVDALGTRLVVAGVFIQHEGESRALVGACFADRDPARAAALAVLNACNRFLGLG